MSDINKKNREVRIAFFDAKPYDIESFNDVNNDSKYNFKIKFFEAKLNADSAVLAKGYEVICAFVNDTISKEVIDIIHGNGTKLLAMRCAGYNNIDLKYIYGKIHVVRVPSYSPYAVAEHSLALMMALNRKIHKAYYRTKDNNFTIKGLVGFDMRGKTAGIIGTGKIGQILITILKGLSMEVIAYDAYPNEKAAKELGFNYVSLEELYKRSHIISLHCPLTKETKHLINRDSIASMKKGIMIINTGRGGLIETRALIEGLKQGIIGSAGLDVYEEESDYFFEDFSAEGVSDDVLARLLTFPNVLITSHQAFFTREALFNIADTTLGNISEYRTESGLENEICYQCDKENCRKKEKGSCF